MFRALGVAALLVAAGAFESPALAQRGQNPATPPPQAPPADPVVVRPVPSRPMGPSPGVTPRATASVRTGANRGVAAVGARPSSIQGAAWQSDNAPVPRAVLRLRNVVTGKLQDTTIANDAGNFVFNTVPDGTYVIELVTQSGKIVMVGQTFTVAPGETVATFVRLGPKIPWFNGFFNNAASAVSSSAASTGVTAIAPEEIPPVSAVR